MAQKKQKKVTSFEFDYSFLDPNKMYVSSRDRDLFESLIDESIISNEIMDLITQARFPQQQHYERMITIITFYITGFCYEKSKEILSDVNKSNFLSKIRKINLLYHYFFRELKSFLPNDFMSNVACELIRIIMKEQNITCNIINRQSNISPRSIEKYIKSSIRVKKKLDELNKIILIPTDLFKKY